MRGYTLYVPTPFKTPNDIYYDNSSFHFFPTFFCDVIIYVPQWFLW